MSRDTTLWTSASPVREAFPKSPLSSRLAFVSFDAPGAPVVLPIWPESPWRKLVSQFLNRSVSPLTDFGPPFLLLSLPFDSYKRFAAYRHLTEKRVWSVQVPPLKPQTHQQPPTTHHSNQHKPQNIQPPPTPPTPPPPPPHTPPRRTGTLSPSFPSF